MHSFFTRLSLFVVLLLLGASPGMAAELDRELLTITMADGGTHDFLVEVARTPEEQAQGLMYRTSMPADSGMIFIFPRVRENASFWMKNTLIPLDMVFIRADGTVARVHSKAIPEDLSPIPAGEPVLAVLELNGGRAAELGIERGATVFSPALSLTAAKIPTSLPVLEE